MYPVAEEDVMNTFHRRREDVCSMTRPDESSSDVVIKHPLEVDIMPAVGLSFNSEELYGRGAFE